MSMLTIDGSQGEGGGQMLRTSLALSLVTQEPVRVLNIRARRSKPGLMRQHLTAVHAAASVSAGTVDGAAVGSTEITFRPGATRGGDYSFSVGTAGSATLVLQTVLPALLLAPQRSSLTLEGGTHNPHSPPFDFLARAFLPLLRRMGPVLHATLERPGFYPAGGGRFHVSIAPSPKLARLELLERGALRSCSARALVASLPKAIADRELDVLRRRLQWEPSCFRSELVAQAQGPGNVVLIELESEHVTEVFTGFGERGLAAETVADGLATRALAYLNAGVPVGPHLADQLLLPLALAGGGAFRSLAPSSHARTQTEILRAFLGTETRMEPVSEMAWHFELSSR
jgi:RNA 3'-terminal phosphate cyclase (ATP)